MAQVFVYGDSFKHQLVGIVVPDAEVLFPWAKQQGIKKSFPSLCNDKEIISTILDSIQAEGRIAGLAGFEQVYKIPFFFRCSSLFAPGPSYLFDARGILCGE